jgi:farnesyl diphosphate synthase
VLALREPTHVFHREQERICVEIDRLFDELLEVPIDRSTLLVEAMRYASIGGGKRLRPLLVAAAADIFDVPRQIALRAGLAAECVHVNSLIHDDLPCMDDDDLRRGKPTVHKVFGEAPAILAGNGLLALAFTVLADPTTHPLAQVRVHLIASLARAVGAAGMAGGQMMDLRAASDSADAGDLDRLDAWKTGALIGWSIGAGAVMGGASNSERVCLDRYASCLGRAFQIADDLLDAEGDEVVVGKRVRKDDAVGRRTFISVLGVEGARSRARALAIKACDHLEPFGQKAELLRAIADFAVTRDR